MKILKQGKHVGDFVDGKFTTTDPELRAWIVKAYSKGCPMLVRQDHNGAVIDRQTFIPLTDERAVGLLRSDLLIGGYKLIVNA